ERHRLCVRLCCLCLCGLWLCGLCLCGLCVCFAGGCGEKKKLAGVLPPCWSGIAWVAGSVGPAPPTRPGVAWSVPEQGPLAGQYGVGTGSVGVDASVRPWNSVVVRSPTVALRQSETFGTATPNRWLISFSCEVWSSTSETIRPPLLNGEITSIGTRTPRPSGPSKPLSAGVGSPIFGGVAVRYSPGVPGGATGGGTWSKNPPCSSNIRNSAVLDHTAGFASSASSTSEPKYIPLTTGEIGWSSNPAGVINHETLGSFPAATSAAKSPGNVGLKALSYSVESGSRNAVKYGSTASE